MLRAVRLVRENRVGILAGGRTGFVELPAGGTNSKIRIIPTTGAMATTASRPITAMIYLCCSGSTRSWPWVVSRVSHQPREPVVHSLGSDAEGPADPTPRQTGIPGSADLAKQLLVQAAAAGTQVVSNAADGSSPRRSSRSVHFRQLRHPEIFLRSPTRTPENLHVEVGGNDGPGARVIDTAGVSPRAVVLVSGPAPVSSRCRGIGELRRAAASRSNELAHQSDRGDSRLGAICRTQGMAFSARE